MPIETATAAERAPTAAAPTAAAAAATTIAATAAAKTAAGACPKAVASIARLHAK